MSSKKLFLSMFFLAIALWTFIPLAKAASDAEFPEGWESWPIIATGSIPSNDTPISSDLPAIIQETFKTYNWIQEGKGSSYNVRINPAQKEALDAGKGEFIDGPTAVLELVDIKVIFVTEHLLGEAQYGVYSFDGKDLSEAHESLAVQTCIKCHTGYKEFFINGVAKR